MNKTELINLLKTNKLWAKKALGQNFLVDEEALNKIVEAAELKPDDMVIEVGPGMGVLTEELVKAAGEVIAIEMDGELAKYLSTKFEALNSKQIQNSKFKILNEDILKVNVPELVGDRKYKVVANIPYYITSKIIRLFLEQKNKPEMMVLLTQKEVAERICAAPGDMSVLSVSVQYFGRPEIVDVVPKESFFPVPKVDSAILKISNIECHSKLDLESRNYHIDSGSQATGRNDEVFSIQNDKEFFRIVNIGFSSKRKTLENNLSAGLRIDKKEAADIIKKAGLSENVRAQELSIQDWNNLVRITNIQETIDQ